jgi:hypothetical protein
MFLMLFLRVCLRQRPVARGLRPVGSSMLTDPTLELEPEPDRLGGRPRGRGRRSAANTADDCEMSKERLLLLRVREHDEDEEVEVWEEVVVVAAVAVVVVAAEEMEGSEGVEEEKAASG